MSDTMGKMDIWNAVSKTDPKHTKKVSFGRKFTAIDAHYQVMKATEQFGPVGEGWGYNVEHHILDPMPNGCVLAVADVWVWHYTRDNSFGPFRGMAEIITVKAPDRVDTDASKKAMTDALTKGLSHLGFSADVFLGLFDDNKYVQQREQEENQASVRDRDIDWSNQCITKMVQAEDLKRLSEMWAKLQPHLEGRHIDAIAALENSFTKLKRKFDEDNNG